VHLSLNKRNTKRTIDDKKSPRCPKYEKSRRESRVRKWQKRHVLRAVRRSTLAARNNYRAVTRATCCHTPTNSTAQGKGKPRPRCSPALNGRRCAQLLSTITFRTATGVAAMQNCFPLLCACGVVLGVDSLAPKNVCVV